jgi:hypothetical protein
VLDPDQRWSIPPDLDIRPLRLKLPRLNEATRKLLAGYEVKPPSRSK